MSDAAHKQDTKSHGDSNAILHDEVAQITKCRTSAARASSTTKGPARRKAKNSSEKKLLNPTKRKLKIRRPGGKCKVKIFDEVGDALNHASFNWMKATRDKCSGSGNVYISYYDEDDEECEISDLEDVETAFECGHEMFHIKVRETAPAAAISSGSTSFRKIKSQPPTPPPYPTLCASGLQPVLVPTMADHHGTASTSETEKPEALTKVSTNATALLEYMMANDPRSVMQESGIFKFNSTVKMEWPVAQDQHLFIRKYHQRLFVEISKTMGEKPRQHPGVLITGNPGIGKSMSIRSSRGYNVFIEIYMTTPVISIKHN